jgi:hypothetical protein
LKIFDSPSFRSEYKNSFDGVSLLCPDNVHQPIKFQREVLLYTLTILSSHGIECIDHEFIDFFLNGNIPLWREISKLPGQILHDQKRTVVPQLQPDTHALDE